MTPSVRFASITRPERLSALPPDRGLLVLFDVDGTLLDSDIMICTAMAEAFVAAGEAPPEPGTIRRLIGLSGPEMVAALATDLDVDCRAKILSGYRLLFCDALERREESHLFIGAEAALVRLLGAGVTLGLTTGKSADSVGQLVEAMRWRDFFRTIQTADRNPSKPSPVMVQKALLETGFAPERTVLVGDTRYDMKMARAAGIRAIGVSWGYNTVQELRAEGAMGNAGDFRHLTDLLIGLLPPRQGGTTSSADEFAAG